MKNNNKNKQKGFTIIELLIYTGITSLVFGLLGSTLITATRLQKDQNDSTQLSRELNFLVNTIKQQLYDAIEIVGIDTHGAPPEAGNIIFRTNAEPTNESEIRMSDFQIQAGVITPVYTLTQISSDKMRIKELRFTKLEDGASTVIHVTITVISDPNYLSWEPQSPTAIERTILFSVSPPALQAQ